MRGEKGEMEWMTAAELEVREEERRKLAEAVRVTYTCNARPL